MWTIILHYALNGETQEPKVFTGHSLAEVKTAATEWEIEQEATHGNAFLFLAVRAKRSKETV